MNIIDINYEKLKKEIIEYTHLQALYPYPEFYIKYNKEPIILMNNETLKFLNQKNEYIQNKSKAKSVPMIFGCYIAIAEWLPFGEVELK